MASLTKDCHSAYASAQDADPAAFDDFSWLMSFWSDDGQQIHALAHHEYQAQRFPRKCDFRNPTQCNYNAITAFVSEDGGKTFQHAGREPVAAPREPQSPSTGDIVGYGPQTNIIRNGGFYYFIAKTNADGEQRAGQCLFRVRDLSEPGDWEYLTEGGWMKSS